MSQPIEYLKGVGPLRADLLKKELGIFTYADLLHHFPFRHIDKTKVTPIAALHTAMDYAQVKGRLIDFQVTGIKSGKRLTAYLKDETGVVELTWFRGLSWVEKNLQQGETYFAFGRVSFFMDKPQMVHPELEPAHLSAGTREHLEPVYSTTEKLKAKALGGRQIAKLTATLFYADKGKGCAGKHAAVHTGRTPFFGTLRSAAPDPFSHVAGLIRKRLEAI